MTVTATNAYNPLIFQASSFVLEKVIQNIVNLAAMTFAVSKVVVLSSASAVAIPDLIVNYYQNANSPLCKITLLPYKILNIGFDALEDLIIRITQKVLDVLNIQISLPISKLQLQATLQEWENENPSEREIRKQANDRIIYHSGALTHWEPFREAEMALLNYTMQSTLSVSIISFIFYKAPFFALNKNTSIDLRDLNLQSLPPVFHHKNFSGLGSLNLGNNRLTTLPENLFNSLNHQTELSIENNNFSDEYLLALNRQQNEPNYFGPRIHSLYFYSLEVERRLRSYETNLRTSSS